MTSELEFYASPGRMTDLHRVAVSVDHLPSSVPELCEVVQGLVLHPFWAYRYGVGGVAERDDEMQLRKASDILDAFQQKALELRFDPLDMWGPWFIRGNIPRDIASLNKVEMLPWDGWGTEALEAPPPEEETDGLAAYSAEADFEKMRELYESDDRVRVPDEITSYLPSGPVRVSL